MTDRTTESLEQFFDTVEQFHKFASQLLEDHKQCKKKLEEHIAEIERLETKNEQLDEKIQSLRLQLSEFAGRMENRIKSIRSETQKLSMKSYDER